MDFEIGTLTKDALYNLDRRSGATPDYARGVLLGVVSVHTEVWETTSVEVLNLLYPWFPDDLMWEAVPPCWFNIASSKWEIAKAPHKIIDFSAIVNYLLEKDSETFEPLLQNGTCFRRALVRSYLSCLAMMERHIKGCSMQANMFYPNGENQIIVEGSVIDHTKPFHPDQVNMGGWVTSNLVMNFGMVISKDGRVSIHT